MANGATASIGRVVAEGETVAWLEPADLSAVLQTADHDRFAPFGWTVYPLLLGRDPPSGDHRDLLYLYPRCAQNFGGNKIGLEGRTSYEGLPTTTAIRPPGRRTRTISEATMAISAVHPWRLSGSNLMVFGSVPVAKTSATVRRRGGPPARGASTRRRGPGWMPNTRHQTSCAPPPGSLPSPGSEFARSTWQRPRDQPEALGTLSPRGPLRPRQVARRESRRSSSSAMPARERGQIHADCAHPSRYGHRQRGSGPTERVGHSTPDRDTETGQEIADEVRVEAVGQAAPPVDWSFFNTTTRNPDPPLWPLQKRPRARPQGEYGYVVPMIVEVSHDGGSSSLAR
jgi:hypothetical protein